MLLKEYKLVLSCFLPTNHNNAFPAKPLYPGRENPVLPCGLGGSSWHLAAQSCCSVLQQSSVLPAKQESTLPYHCDIGFQWKRKKFELVLSFYMTSRLQLPLQPCLLTTSSHCQLPGSLDSSCQHQFEADAVCGLWEWGCMWKCRETKEIVWMSALGCKQYSDRLGYSAVLPCGLSMCVTCEVLHWGCMKGLDKAKPELSLCRVESL